MMHRSAALLITCLFALAGCGKWVKPGVSPQVRDRDLTTCTYVGYQEVPVAPVVVADSGDYVSSQTSCQTYKDRNSRDSKEHEECTYTPGYWTPPRESLIDSNDQARDASINSCMYSHGYEWK